MHLSPLRKGELYIFSEALLWSFFPVTALRSTTAGNAAIMGQMEILFSFLILGILWKHEKIMPAHVVGSLAMVVGAVLILLPKTSGGWHVGDMLVLLSTIIAPFGNVFGLRRSISFLLPKRFLLQASVRSSH